jgi:hypothetical protein
MGLNSIMILISLWIVCLFNPSGCTRLALTHHATAGAVYVLLRLFTDEEKITQEF